MHCMLEYSVESCILKDSAHSILANFISLRKDNILNEWAEFYKNACILVTMLRVISKSQ